MIGAPTTSLLPGHVVSSLIETSISLSILIACAAVLDLVLQRLRRPHLRPIPWLLVLGRAAVPTSWLEPFGFVPGVVPPDLLVSAAQGTTDLSTWALASTDRLLLLGWIVGVIAFATFGAVRYRSVRRRLLARATAEVSPRWRSAAARATRRIGLARIPRLRAVPGLPSPLVLGVWRPLVLVPPNLPSGGKAGYEHVLLHEFAHLARRDPLLSAISATVQIIYWFHPLLWWARGRLAGAIELATDARVATVLREETTEYRSTLLRLASHTHRIAPPPLPPPPAAGLGFITRRATIVRRLRALEAGPIGGRGGQRMASLGLTLVLTLTLLPMCRLADRPLRSTVVDLTPRELLAADPAGCLLTQYAVLAALSEEAGSEKAPAPR